MFWMEKLRSLSNKTNKCLFIQYIFSNMINCQHISFALAIVMKLILQEYQEYQRLKTLPNCISEPLNVKMNASNSQYDIKCQIIYR
jgi:hypothetical protein